MSDEIIILIWVALTTTAARIIEKQYEKWVNRGKDKKQFEKTDAEITSIIDGLAKEWIKKLEHRIEVLEKREAEKDEKIEALENRVTDLEKENAKKDEIINGLEKENARLKKGTGL